MPIREAWIMHLKPGAEAEYRRRHDELWPELRALMRRDGIRNYSIFLREGTLFAYLERDEPAPEGAPVDEIVWRWWRSMAPLMATNPDSSPIREPLVEVFHVD